MLSLDIVYEREDHDYQLAIRRQSQDFLCSLALEMGLERLAPSARGCPLIEGGDPLAPPLSPAAMNKPQRDILDLASAQFERALPSVAQWHQIISEVIFLHHRQAVKHGLTMTMLWGRHRPEWLMRIRQEIWYRAKRELEWSYPQIGKRSGDRDHTTIMHGVKAHESRLKRHVTPCNAM